jgi:phenol hydroxylase P1 protein
VKDWFELFVAQNVVLDGLLYPLVYDHRRRRCLGQGGGGVDAHALHADWFAETRKWVDATHQDRRGRIADNKATAGRLDPRTGAPVPPRRWLPVASWPWAEGAGEASASVARRIRARIAKAGVAL